jgi:hypothetical protein
MQDAASISLSNKNMRPKLRIGLAAEVPGTNLPVYSSARPSDFH